MVSSVMYNVLFLVAIGVVVIAGICFYALSIKMRKSVQEALEDATTEEQTIIRNKVVKAMFPPRFTRD
jgi:sensor domain CHASE-containing protein